MGCGLRLHRDGMEDMNTANLLPLDERAQRAYHSFDFGQFGHRRENRSGTRFERERMLFSQGLSGIAKRSKNRLAFVPIRKLVQIVAAPGLPRFAGSSEENRLIPVCGIRHKTHGRPKLSRGKSRK